MSVIREDQEFTSGSERCAAWVYRPDGGQHPGTRPAVILGHGLGAVREMGLDAYAQRFAAEGIVAVVFDYRYFGASSGQPRQLLSVRAQLADWDAAIAFAKHLEGVDPARIAVWGSSFGGGHAIATAAAHPELAAAVAQCPFTDGIASSFALGPKSLLKVAPLALRDELAALAGRPPVHVELAGPPGSAGLMTAPDVEPGYRALIPAGVEVPSTVAARIGTRIGFYRPGRRAAKVRLPLFVAACRRDSVAPVRTTVRLVRKAPQLELHEYDLGHFDIYVGAGFAQTIEDQVAFLRRTLTP